MTVKPLASEFRDADLFITEHLGVDLANKCVVRNVYVAKDWDEDGKQIQRFTVEVHGTPLFPDNPLLNMRLESEEFVREELENPGVKLATFREKVDAVVAEFLNRSAK